MAPTRPPSTTSIFEQSMKRSPSSGPAASSGVSKAGRHKNQWTAERRRKAVRLYFFYDAIPSRDRPCSRAWLLSDNERRIRELFLEGEVPSRSRWCKHNAAGNQNSIAQWELFEQYKVRPWKRSRNCMGSNQPATTRTAEAREGDASVLCTKLHGHFVSRKQPGEHVINRVNQLGSKYLPAHLRSIARVYCHSITSTVRSSWISLTSTFRSSEASSIYRRSTAHENESISSKFKPLDPLLKRISAKLPSALTKEEQWGWDILIDEQQFERNSDDAITIKDDRAASRRKLLWIAAEYRKLKPPAASRSCLLRLDLRTCRGQHRRDYVVSTPGEDGDDCCRAYSCSTLQKRALLEGFAELRYAKLDLDLDLSMRDFYDNTLLFYYVNSPYFTVEGLKKVANGADIMAQNSSGATFMHYYAWDWPQRRPAIFRCLEMVYDYSYSFCRELIDILEFLTTKNFPFSHRNEHGQTIAHLLFEHMCLDKAKIPCVQQLDRILTALNTDIDALDNQGHCVSQYLDLLDRSFLDEKSRQHYEALIVTMSRSSSLNSGNLMLDFQKLCSSAQSRGHSWPAIVKALGYSSLIDVKGDSPLIAMLKVWDESRHINDRYRCIEELLQQGTGVDLKDRRGNTALVIAARRGFRSTVEQLLESGANANVINYATRSIIFMAKGWLNIAKKRKDNLRYARIASCIPVLQRWQAVFEPSTHQQLLSAKTRAKLVAGQLQSSQATMCEVTL